MTNQSQNPPTPHQQPRFIYRDQHQAREEVEGWLQRTMLPWPGGLVPRETLYALYKEFCASCGLESTTVSGFGRLVYRVFPQLTSRRIGTRPNTKMNYSNVRLASPDETKPPPQPTGSVGSPPPSPSSSTVIASLAPRPSPTASSDGGQSPPFDAPPAFSPLGVTLAPSGGDGPTSEPGIPQWSDQEQDLLNFLSGEPSPELSNPATGTTTTTTTTATPFGGSQHRPMDALCSMIRPEGYRADPRAHPWVTLPILASLEMVERSTSDDPAHTAQLARAIERFLVMHDSSGLEEAGNGVLRQFNRDPYDVTAYDCLFVVAWWQRFLLGEPHGRSLAAATLGRMLCGPAASAAVSFSPAIEMLRSCTHGPLSFGLNEGDLERVVVQSALLMEKNDNDQKNEDETKNEERKRVTGVVRDSVAAVLLTALRSRTSLIRGDRSHITQLARTLGQVREPSVLALCLHELDNRDLLETTLHMLPFAFPDDSPALRLLVNQLMVRSFPMLHRRMTTLLPAFAPPNPNK